MTIRTMRAGEFKTRCLKIMDQVQKTREPLVITKRGRPVAKLVPADKPGNDIFGCLKGVIKIVGDIESPVVPAEDWKALR
jgi:prevent-host-death family protein